MISTSRERIRELATRFNSSDGIVIAVGVSAIVVGVLVDVFIVRLLCLFVVIGSAGLLYALLRVRQMNVHIDKGDANSPFRSQSASEGMKKLVFDDLRQDSGEKYLVEEIEEEDAVGGSVQSHAGVPSPPPARHAISWFCPGTSGDRRGRTGVSDFGLFRF